MGISGGSQESLPPPSFYDDHKEKIHLYLIHGYRSSGAKWDEYVEELQERGYVCHVVEYDSFLPYVDYTAIKYALRAHLNRNGHTYTSENVYFIGHSQGGMHISDNYAIPEDKIITINSPFARRGFNYRNERDLLAGTGWYGGGMRSIEGISGSEGHGQLPSIDQLIRETGIRSPTGGSVNDPDWFRATHEEYNYFRKKYNWRSS